MKSFATHAVTSTSKAVATLAYPMFLLDIQTQLLPLLPICVHDMNIQQVQEINKSLATHSITPQQAGSGHTCLSDVLVRHS